MKISQALSDAERRIIDRGWTSGVLSDGFGRVCAIGALWSLEDENADYATVNAARKTLGELLGVPSIAAWNDAPGRDINDVVLAFRLASRTCKER